MTKKKKLANQLTSKLRMITVLVTVSSTIPRTWVNLMSKQYVQMKRDSSSWEEILTVISGLLDAITGTNWEPTLMFGNSFMILQRRLRESRVTHYSSSGEVNTRSLITSTSSQRLLLEKTSLWRTLGFKQLMKSSQFLPLTFTTWVNHSEIPRKLTSTSEFKPHTSFELVWNHSD